MPRESQQSGEPQRGQTPEEKYLEKALKLPDREFEKRLQAKLELMEAYIGKYVEIRMSVYNYSTNRKDWETYKGVLKELSANKIVLERQVSNGRSGDLKTSSATSTIKTEIDIKTQGPEEHFLLADYAFASPQEAKESQENDSGPRKKNG